MTAGRARSGLLDGVMVADRPARLLFVHAHPDDESIATGVAIAHHAARGDDVHVLTCTLGEEGEVIPTRLAHLQGADGDPLAEVRRRELASAVAALGATSHLLAVDAATDRPAYRDSGMAGSPAASHPRAWAGIGLGEAAVAVATEIQRLAPDVVVTYDASGGYGHPDHIRTHEATCRAVASVDGPAPALFGILTPRFWARAEREWLSRHVPAGQGWIVPAPGDDYPPSVVDDDVVTRSVLDVEAVASKFAALLAHETQVTMDDGWYALSNRVASSLGGYEGYARLDPGTGAPLPEEVP